jgi:hypothetical protein
MWGRTIGSVGGTCESFKAFGMGHYEYKTFIERDVRGRKRCMYLLCDFNGKWLKDSSLLCCIIILLREEGRVVSIIK